MICKHSNRRTRHFYIAASEMPASREPGFIHLCGLQGAI